MTYEISTFNSNVESFKDQVKGKIDSIHSALNELLKKSQGPPSSNKLSHFESADSSHTMAFHSNSLHSDPCLPRVEVKKFDGSNPTGWVTQMEHYFSLHNITDELVKFHYNVFYLDPER
jgi:hypothetical protein